MNPAPVMILGCGRSGTSIFGELFDGLGPYSYSSEPPFSDVLATSEHGVMATKVPTESTGHAPDLGLSFPLDVLLRAQPAIQIFWIVRHPLDAISSLKVGIENNWGHHPRPPDWETWLHRPLIERCARHWVYINQHGFDRVRDRAVLVRFEDMIRDPLSFATNVCQSGGVGCRRTRTNTEDLSDRVQDSNNDKFIEARTSRSYSRRDHSVRVGRWRENISEEEVRRAAAIVARIGERFGYDLSGLDK